MCIIDIEYFDVDTIYIVTRDTKLQKSSAGTCNVMCCMPSIEPIKLRGQIRMLLSVKSIVNKNLICFMFVSRQV